MRRLVAGAGALVVLAGIALAFAAIDVPTESGFEGALAMLVLTGAVLALWKIGRSLPEDADVAIPPWAPGGAIVYGDPERTPTDHPLSAEELSGVVAAAGATARQEGTVEDGLAVLQEPLRAALVDALVLGGTDREAVERSIRRGEWTDNEWAASVVEPSVGAPRWSLRQRFRAWLFPEDTVERLARVAVHGVARAAEDAIPTVPGQGAPRTVPVARPTLADLERGADGDLQEAVEPTAIARGPTPPTSHHGLDERIDDGDEEGGVGPGNDEASERIGDGEDGATADEGDGQTDGTRPTLGDLSPTVDPAAGNPPDGEVTDE